MLAVLLAVLTVTAPVTAPVAAASPTPASQPIQSTGTDNVSTKTTETLDANASAFKYRLAAYERLTRAADRSAKRQPKLTKFRGELNRTFQHFRDRNRVADRAVFQADKQAAAALSEHHPRVSAWLVDADQRLAMTAVSDAERVLATLSNRSATFDRAAASKSLRKARRALAKGDRLHEKGNPAAAIAHYRQAWTHAQIAIDVMDAGVGPTVTITNRSDPVRNGSANYTIRGSVFAVRPGEIDAVTVRVNGEPQKVRIRAGTVPGTTQSFKAEVHLDERVVNLTVVAAEPENTQPGHQEQTTGDQGDVEQNKKQGKNGKKGGTGPKNGQGSGPDDPSVQTDRAVLLLDGDGLPDRYEQNRTDTDPLNPDSNSGATDAVEAGNGTHDGLEDYDGDGLVTLRERALTTDPLDADTDADNLSDQAELVWTDTSPLAPDSDDDGISDGREDPDNDTLVNVDELANTADPHQADTDGDGLRDPAELDLGTEPFEFDTDADGLGDNAELHDPFNTDPLDPDTDGDGIQDGNETYTTQAVNESVGATISLTGEGNAARSVTIHNRTSAFQAGGVQNQTVSPIVDIEARENFSTATVTLQYDASKVTDGNASDLAVFRYDPKLQTFVKLDSEVDTANHTVSAETSHFSIYTAFATSEFVDSFGSGLPSPWSVAKEFDRLGTWTCSGSCRTDRSTLVAGAIGSGGGGGGRIQTTNNDSGGDFHILCAIGPTPDCDIDDDGVPNQDDHCPGTYGDGPNGCPTDDDDDDGGGGGEDPEPTQHTEVTHTYSFDGAHDITVRLRVKGSVSEADSGVFVELGDTRVFELDSTTSTGWRTITADVSEYAGGEMLVRVVADNQSVVQVDSLKIEKHSDGDSIPDNIEEEGMPVGAGTTISTDPENADTDGDRLDDDEEIFLDQVIHHPQFDLRYYDWLSDPTEKHSDSDDLDDYEETQKTWIPIATTKVDGETRPLRYASSSEMFDTTMAVTSDPLFPDSDFDGLSDHVEREELHTDPERKITYELTRRHQRQVVDDLYERWKAQNGGGATTSAQYIEESARAMGLLDPGQDPEALGSMELTDATGDFDFVTADDGDYVFRALDNHKRTDTWFSNQHELGYTDPWDPDHDNDGLTDGQEVKGITTVNRRTVSRYETVRHVTLDAAQTYHTNPLEKDTDEDGYWDGWIGVYSAENSTNVLLYQDHLRDEGDGLKGAETVEEQAGIHRVDAAPTAMGADLYDNGTKYHSNIHIGELQWGTNPLSKSETPDTGLSIEVDYYAGASISSLDTSQWVEGIERNYEMYGMDVELERDEVLQDGDFMPCVGTLVPPNCVYSSDGFTAPEIIGIELRQHQTDAKEYVLIADRGAGILIPNAQTQTGVNIPGSPAQAIFTEAHKNEADLVERRSSSERNNSFYPDALAFVTAKTEIHEIGHSYGAGAADDDFVRSPMRLGEIYSGEQEDRTPERLRQNGPTLWSVMVSGWQQNLIGPPMEGRYFSYSIEEVSTIDTEDG